VHLVRQDLQGLQVVRVQRDRLVHLVQRVLRAQQVPQVQLGLEEMAKTGLQDPRASPAPLDPQVNQVRLQAQALQALQDRQAPQASQVLLVGQALQAPLGKRDLQVRRDLQA
jgi:hypothetical protein